MREVKEWTRNQQVNKLLCKENKAVNKSAAMECHINTIPQDPITNLQEFSEYSGGIQIANPDY